MADMNQSSSFAASNISQQSPMYASMGRDATTTRSPSVSSSDAENGTTNEPGNGSKKRKRSNSVKISCESCKGRKVKCDRGEPACGWCVRNKKVCIYRERKQPGIRVGYGRELEEKINRLEAIVQVLGRRVEDHISEHDFTQTTYQSTEFTSHPRDHRLTNTHSQSRITPTPDHELSQVRSEEPTPYSRPPDTMSIQSAIESIMPENPAQVEPPSSSIPLTDYARLSTPAESDLPPYDILYTLVDLYFKHVNTWSPILDRQATLDKIFGGATLGEADRALAHAIVATTLRFFKDSCLTPESRSRYFNVSKQKVQLYAMENPSVKSLQALVILTVGVLGTSNGLQGSSLLALVARSLVHLGLGVERGVFLESETIPSIGISPAFVLQRPKSWIEDEERRRLFWQVYILDRYATIATSFDFVLDEKDMDRSLPTRYDLFSQNHPVETKWFGTVDGSDTIVNKPGNLGSFSYHCEVLRILTRIHRFLKRPVDIGSADDVRRWRESYRQLGNELDSWLQHLPGEYGQISQLCHQDPGSKISNWILLHAAFVTSVIRLHSSAAYPTVRSHLFAPSYTAMNRCLSAVESMREISQDVVSSGMLDLLGPPFAFSLWVSARLLLVHAATGECEVDSKIHFFISTLESMGQYWEIAQSYANILSDIMVEQQHRQHKTITAMRRCAYDLSLLLFQRPRTVLNPSSIKLSSQKELEYLEIFDFFNYPRVVGNLPISLTTATPSTMATPMDEIHANHITFTMPNPESDWLSFKAPYD